MGSGYVWTPLRRAGNSARLASDVPINRPGGARLASGVRNLAPPARLFQVVPQLLRPGRVAQLAQRFRLDLADALPRHAESLPHLFQRPLVPVDQAEPQLQ